MPLQTDYRYEGLPEDTHCFHGKSRQLSPNRNHGSIAGVQHPFCTVAVQRQGRPYKTGPGDIITITDRHA